MFPLFSCQRTFMYPVYTLRWVCQYMKTRLNQAVVLGLWKTQSRTIATIYCAIRVLPDYFLEDNGASMLLQHLATVSALSREDHITNTEIIKILSGHFAFSDQLKNAPKFRASSHLLSRKSQSVSERWEILIAMTRFSLPITSLARSMSFCLGVLTSKM